MQLPSIQTKVAHKAASWLSEKTKTPVKVGEVKISFTGNLICKGIYLEDRSKDTLLSASEININIAFLPLLRNEIKVKNVALTGIHINLNRTKGSDNFNYQFLIDAFADSTKTKAPKDTSAQAMKIELQAFELNDLNFNYNDGKSGSYVAATLKELHLSMENIDLEKQVFDIDKFIVDGLLAAIRTEVTDSPEEEKEPAKDLPLLSANGIVIRNSNIVFADSNNQQAIRAALGVLRLDQPSMNLNTTGLKLGRIFLASSDLQYQQIREVATDSLQATADTLRKESTYDIAINTIELLNNKVSYDQKWKPDLSRSFSASHLNYRNLSLKAKDLKLKPGTASIAISEMSAKDQKGFELKGLEGAFAMTEQSISLRKVRIETKESLAEIDVTTSFDSLATIGKNPGQLTLDANLSSITLKTSEALYFSPLLVRQPFFRYANNKTRLSGKIKGPLDDLKVDDLEISTAGSTTINGSLIIKGLPDAKKIYAETEALTIRSGKADLLALLGTAIIPNTIDLPAKLDLVANFKGGLKAFDAEAQLVSSFGNVSVTGSLQQDESFAVRTDINAFDLGRLLRNSKTFGPVTLVANAEGQGLSAETISAVVDVDGKRLYLNQYSYENLLVKGKITGQQFEGKISLKDRNAEMYFDGLVNTSKDNSHYKFKLDLQAADLKALKLTEKDLRIGMMAVADLKGHNMNDINGKAGITKIVLAHEGKKYILDSLLFASINEKNKSELNVSSAVIGLKYNGTFAPADLAKELKTYINNYFNTDSLPAPSPDQDQQFTFELELKNHPVLNEVFFPELKVFDPGLITGSFNSREHRLDLQAEMRNIEYAAIKVKDLKLVVSSDAQKLNYTLTCDQIAGSKAGLQNLTVEGRLQDQNIYTALNSLDDEKKRKLSISTVLSRENKNYRLHIEPQSFVLQEKQWTLPADNYIVFGPQGSMFHNLSLTNGESVISVVSVNQQFNDDLQIDIKKLKLDEISRVVETDTSLVSGEMNGDILLKRAGKSYGIVANAALTALTIQTVPVGDVKLTANNTAGKIFDLDLKLEGNNNNLTLGGKFNPESEANALDMNLDIKSLNIKAVEALSMGALKEGQGTITGNIKVTGPTKSPKLNGQLSFQKAALFPTALNARFTMENETVYIREDGLTFKNFTIKDQNQQPAVISGTIGVKDFKDFLFDLEVNTRNFTLINTVAGKNEVFYGTMVIDSKIKVTGTQALPVVNAGLKLREGTNFTFIVPEKKLTTDRGEDVVIFIDSATFHPILTRNEKVEKQKSGIKGIDISSTIEVDKEATLRLMLDPSSSDSLVVKGDAALSFALDPSGKTSLTGTYDLQDGSYLVSLENLVKRKFRIEPGSTIIWNGDPLDADVNINAIYDIRTSPIDLVADQVSGLTEADKNGYRQRFPFMVYLKLRGVIMRPEISFEIQLPPEEKGILGGAVNAKLNMLNEDPSALNKQVFALLVLGRFIQEDPLQTETNAMASAARTTVGKFLSAQLNQLSQKALPGVELNFDIQSYDDYSTGQAEGRTEVEVGLKKQLFNDRLEVQVGGTVDVEGERAKQNNASDITSDVTLEYKLTKDGRYRLRGFRHNQYEGALDGQLVETGGGVLYIRDFDKWKEFFTAPRRKPDEDAVYNDSIPKR